MLYLIGLGVGDENDMNLKAISSASKCKKIYFEKYTNKWLGNIEKLANLIGKDIDVINREKLENDSFINTLINYAQKEDVCILIPGDPLAATTHMEIVIQAKKHSCNYKIVHNSSILSVVAETGLQLYKFGETITLPRPKKEYRPTSWYDKIQKNLKHGLHTLLLLETDMTIKEALDIIHETEEKAKNSIKHKPEEHILKKKVVACSCIGTDKQKIAYGYRSNLEKRFNYDDIPAVVIIPGKMHFKEEEALKILHGENDG